MAALARAGSGIAGAVREPRAPRRIGAAVPGARDHAGRAAAAFEALAPAIARDGGERLSRADRGAPSRLAGGGRADRGSSPWRRCRPLAAVGDDRASAAAVGHLAGQSRWVPLSFPAYHDCGSDKGTSGMTRQYLAGELSARLERLQSVTSADHAEQVARLRGQ